MSRATARKIQTIYIANAARNDELTRETLDAHPQSRKVFLDNDDLPEGTAESAPKQILFLTHSRGHIVKACPGTADCYLCCRYQVINQTLNCPLQCSYCILQYYLNQPATVIYTDVEKILHEARRKLAAQPRRFFRVGTGELGDSLALPGSVGFARRAVPFFAEIPNALLELKSKTTNIDSILPLQHGGRTVLAWSLNPSPMIRRDESGAATLENRLAAAAKAQEAGFLLGFHFDPMIIADPDPVLYVHLAQTLYDRIDPQHIAWISIGSLRYPPSMKDKMLQSYPRSTLPFGEMIRGMDDKMRYARPVRLPFYRALYCVLQKAKNPPFIYFCMESPLVWREVMGYAPDDNAHFDYLFAMSLYRRFPGLFTEEPPREVYENGFALEESPAEAIPPAGSQSAAGTPHRAESGPPTESR